MNLATWLARTSWAVLILRLILRLVVARPMDLDLPARTLGMSLAADAMPAQSARKALALAL